MSLLSRRIPYDRKRMLTQAEALAGSWRWRKALALYRQILAAEPHNAEIHAKLAPLLARSGRTAEAWESFQVAIRALSKAGNEAGARKLQKQAARALPLEPEAIRLLARTELSLGRGQQAIQRLLEGSQRLARRRPRGASIVLLRDARTLDPWNKTVVLELCRQLARDGQPAEALFLLDQLEDRVAGDDLCEARALCWRIEPSLRHSWRWLRAVRERRSGGLARPSPSRS